MTTEDAGLLGEAFGIVAGSGLWVWLGSLAARPGQTGRTLTTAMVAAAIMAALAFVSYQAGTPGERVLLHLATMAPFYLLWLGVAHLRFKRQERADQPARSSSTTRKASASSKASRLT